MLKIKNVNKYFNKGKKNELHVINNTTLEFDNNGLVALLGPSGCGKTTLLNTIGGLDKIKSGSIYVDGKKISSKITHKKDKIRNLNVGYIFQDYKLIDDLSVYDNISLVLKMIGIRDKDEINARVEFVLERVGMLRYRRRPAGMLSGGERQRVGIARALVKDPNIILADEPTGNLDSKNSLEIMKIIKAISKDRLVILVTHEQDLAKFYATRIVEIKDGVVSKDYLNEHNDNLDYAVENTFYLKDFSDKEVLNKDNVELNVYSENNEKLKLDIVLRNGNIYIQTKNNEKIEIVDDRSSIEFLDEHYKKIEKADIDNYSFNFKEVINNDIKKKYSSIFNPISLIINGFKKVFDFSLLKKFLLIGYFVSAMFVMYSLSTTAANLNITEDRYIQYNKNYLYIDQAKNKLDEYYSLSSNENVDYIMPDDSSVKLMLSYKRFFSNYASLSLSFSLSDINMINEDNLISGRMPENDYEIVVDKLAFDKNKTEDYTMMGIISYEDLIGTKLLVNDFYKLKIVGISNMEQPNAYMARHLFNDVIINKIDTNSNSPKKATVLNYNILKDNITLKKGRMPENDYEVIVPIFNSEAMPLDKVIDVKINDTKLKVVGYYDSKENYDYLLVSAKTEEYNLILNSKGITVNPKNRDKLLETLKEKDINAVNTFEKSKEIYMDNAREGIINSLILSGIILGISLIEIFFMIRASFLSRIKEIGIYRAIGVKKADIYKMFFGEIFAITTLASMPGIIFMAYILKTMSSVSFFGNMFIINGAVVAIAIIGVYLFNLFIGLFPVFSVVNKTPAQILARHDLE